MERLTDDRFLKDGFYQPKSKDEEKEIRSMANDLTFEKLYRHCAEVEKENLELQKQVDELKGERANLKMEISTQALKFEALKTGKLIVGGICEVLNEAKKTEIREQAVKDTAKEILDELFYMASIHHSDVANILAWAKEKAKSKGVEVEL